MRYLVAAVTVAALASCSPGNTGNQQAQLRNDPPATCTQDQLAACPAPAIEVCADGTMPVLDYSSDCCAHFSCQPVCKSAIACTRSPAPVCPAGTKLWIGTALEDCCPAYRCEPVQDPTCGGKNVVCSLALPYCGAGIDPVVVGQTPDCCPIYQCPCDKTVTGSNAPADQSKCGCTYPICKPGEELQCLGMNICGYPCECKPAQGTCKADSECGPGARCDVSKCLVPPSTGSAPALCDPAKCGPAPLMPTKLCADGKTTSGPTGRCLATANGTCAWEIGDCSQPVPPMPPADCYGVCVPNVVAGCKADFECPSGQKCEMSCSTWGCGPDATTNVDKCACPAGDPTCACDSSGFCKGQQCQGKCVPALPPPTCSDLDRPIACTAVMPTCQNGAKPAYVGDDPATCCPVYKCPACASSTNVACAVPDCVCAIPAGTDPNTCCPIYKCGQTDSTGKCQ